MADERVPTLIDLDDAKLILENPDDDIRGRKVIAVITNNSERSTDFSSMSATKRCAFSE